MPVDDQGSVFLAWSPVAALIAGLFLWLFRMAAKIGVIELKVETLWAFLFRRGVIEGLQKGWIQENSPMELTDKALEAMAPMTLEIRTWYKQAGVQLSDLDLLLHIEHVFGNKMSNEICKPNLISNGVCLVAAALICGRKLDSTGQ